KFGITLMTRFCQWQRLVATNILPEVSKSSDVPEVDFELDQETYCNVLSYLRLTDPEIRNHIDIPHPDNSKVFLNYAKELSVLHCDHRPNKIKISKKPPNNIVQYQGCDNKSSFGSVLHILKVLVKNERNTLIFIQQNDEQKYLPTQPLGVICKSLSIIHLKSMGNFEIVQPHKILGICAYRQLPAWSMGLKKPSMLVCLIREGDIAPETDTNID
ncbi:hypothetical protein O181_033555, partial [Austropuccinia psidii MF-1]|nr:hypothetical protein [Austropuccinia psidii MF-1]